MAQGAREVVSRRRLKILFTGFERFWMQVARDGLASRCADELDVSWIEWPSTFSERVRFIIRVLRSDLVIRMGMPFEFESETNRFFLWLSVVLPVFHPVNYWIGDEAEVFLANGGLSGLSERDRRAIDQMSHLAVTEHIAEEMSAAGVPTGNAELMGPERDYPDVIPPLPEQLRVLSYWGDTRFDYFSGPAVFAAARALPDVQFDVLGTTGEVFENVPDNVRFHGQVADVISYMTRSTVLVRVIRFDALPSSMVEEAMLLGRHFIYSLDWPATIKVDYGDSVGLIAALRGLKESSEAGTLELNMEGREFTLVDSDPDAQAEIMREEFLRVHSEWRARRSRA